MMIHHDLTTQITTVSTICKNQVMQQTILQFLTKFGLYNIYIECTEGVHMFHWLWNGRTFYLNLSQFELFSKKWIYLAKIDILWYCYNYISSIQSYWKALFWMLIENPWKVEIYYFFQSKIIKMMITTWKLSSSKVCHGFDNALGICVHENHCQVLPTQMVPICENLGLGPWTISTSASFRQMTDEEVRQFITH